MTTTWFYSGNVYSTEALANAAVLDQKARLDNNPTDWVTVKELSGNESDGWVVSGTTLTDSEINNLDDTKHYNVSSVLAGDNDLGLTASEATAKTAEYTTVYADQYQVNTLVKTEAYSPSNADMSVYTAS